MNIRLVAVAGLCWAFIGGVAIARAHETAKPRAEIFRDDFSGVARQMPDGSTKLYPDAANWAFTFWPGVKWPDSYGNGTNWLEGNGECQTYVTPFLEKVNAKPVPVPLRYDPFAIDGDGLHIRAGLLTPAQRAAYRVEGARMFASGLLLSRKSFLYGRLSMRARLPAARGSWPAFWLLPDSHDWPPEIDIVEAMPWGRHDRQIHIGLLTPKSEKGGFGRWVDVGADPSDGFHDYALVWTPKTLTFYFDGRELARRPTPPSLHRPMYMLINLAVGGKWVFNELGVPPVDSLAPERLLKGAALIKADYPAEMIVQSVSVESLGE